jgi:protoporphyrin/coproporphyrin ferrochelatase
MPPIQPERIGLLIVNLGTPDNTGYWATRRYLKEFLSDPRVIDAPRFIWWPVLNGIILTLRPLKSARAYRRIWLPEGSPLAVYSKRLAAKIAGQIATERGPAVHVELAMTYGTPSIATAIEALVAANVQRLLVLPLYPQCCASTTGSVFDALARELQAWRWVPQMRFINQYFDCPGYDVLLADSVRAFWASNGRAKHLLFSFHGIPQRYCDEGDPYYRQVQATAAAAAARLGLSAEEWSLAFQSRFGPVEWLRPYAPDVLRELAAKKIPSVDVLSPSFAVDCLETLEEIGIGYREEFHAMSGGELRLIPALNDSDTHAKFLAALACDHMHTWRNASEPL